MKAKLTIIKIGGGIIDDKASLASTLDHFANLEGKKILIHGGGRLATELAGKLGVQQTLIEGRRVTDAETLKITTMVYAGWINKSMVATLVSRGVNALGVSGVDQNLIQAKKRADQGIDFGFVGDVEKVNVEVLSSWLANGITPIIAPITHDGTGQLLNTNADTIANEVAKALAREFSVTLVYSFEKSGVLLDVENESSRIQEISFTQFQELKGTKKIFAGMIPKLENAFQAIESGVDQVLIGMAQDLPNLLAGTTGTKLKYGKS